MADTAHVKGLDALQKMLDTLPVKIEKNIMRSALRAGAKVIKDRAAANLGSSSRTGDLVKSLAIGTRARGHTVTASVKAKAFYAGWVEFGTAAHVIAGRNGGWLAFGGTVRKSVNHPGARPHPFLRPALDSSQGAALMAVGEQVKRRLTKAGIDATHVPLEGDE